MSHQGLDSLLDEMLADPQFAATTQREAEADPMPEVSSTEFTDVEQLRALGDVELARVLALVARDDLLTTLSGASDGLRRRILTTLSAESVRWLKQNLAYFDEPTRALLAAGRRKVLAAANRLLEAGTVALPKAPAAQGEAATPDEVERVGGVLAVLLALVQERGRGALGDVVSAGDPLLDEGLAMVLRAADEGELAEALDARTRALMSAYARRLAVVREGVLALRRGEDPEAFRKRLDGIGG